MKGQEEDQGLHASLSGVAAMENHVKGSSNRQPTAKAGAASNMNWLRRSMLSH